VGVNCGRSCGVDYVGIDGVLVYEKEENGIEIIRGRESETTGGGGINNLKKKFECDRCGSFCEGFCQCRL
jgi:hypothetical protein